MSTTPQRKVASTQFPDYAEDADIQNNQSNQNNQNDLKNRFVPRDCSVEPSNMRAILAILALIVIGIAAYFYFASGNITGTSPVSTSQQSAPAAPQATPPATDQPSANAPAANAPADSTPPATQPAPAAPSNSTTP